MKKLLFFTHPLFFTLLFNAHNELKPQLLKVCYYLKNTKAEGGQTFLMMRRKVFFLSCGQVQIKESRENSVGTEGS